MKHTRKVVGFLIIFVGLIFATTSVYAEPEAPTAITAITGSVFDGKTGSPWQYGAEVAIISGGAVVGNGVLDQNGHFSIVPGNDPFGLCGGTCPTTIAFGSITAVIQFTCDIQVVNVNEETRSATLPIISDDPNCPAAGPLPSGVGGPALVGLPSNILADSIVVNPSNTTFDFGTIDTNRGPTAVSLNTFSAANQPTSFLPAIAALLLITFGALLLVKRQRS